MLLPSLHSEATSYVSGICIAAPDVYVSVFHRPSAGSIAEHIALCNRIYYGHTEGPTGSPVQRRQLLLTAERGLWELHSATAFSS
jgi:hypothetical protein